MSGRGGRGSANNNNTNYNSNKVNNSDNNGKQQIPAAASKVVQSLKEVVRDMPDSEIYAALRDCNMDPDEAVNRLLSQDTFHEVKSKREKKKESKDTTDVRSRSANNVAYCVGKGSTDHYARGGSSQYGSNESGLFHGKPAYRKDNGIPAYAGASSSGMAGSNSNWQLPFLSEPMAKEDRILHPPVDGVFSSVQSSSGLQSAWAGAPGQVSMADVVKMGRPHNKAAVLPSQYGVNHHHDLASASVAMQQDSHFSENFTSKVSDINSEQENVANNNFHADDEWPSIEQPPAVNVSLALEVPRDSDIYLDPTQLASNKGNQVQSLIEDVQSTEEVENDATTIVTNLHQLSLENADHGAVTEEDNPSVIIPDHLQVHGQDCSHLSFGSFGSSINSNFPGLVSSRTLNKLEETSEVADGSSTGLLVSRNHDYCGDDRIRSTMNENSTHGGGVSAGTYDSIPVHQPEVVKSETPEHMLGSQYTFSPSAPGYSFENTQQLNATFRDVQTSSQMPDITPFSSVMQAYSNSLPSTLLASTGHNGRESDQSYAHFSIPQSMPTKYNNVTSSISGPSISMSEALRAASISTAEPTQQSLGGGNAATAPSLLQQLPLHQYSQPTLPLGPFANMMGYPFLSQSYAYMPSAFQQSFTGNSAYHQALAAMLPHYKNSLSASSLPLSAALSSGYGFGSSNSLPESNCPLNPPTGPTGTTLGYDDLLPSQYKEVNHLISPLQQNENSATWVHGPGSRTMSGVPGNAYYSLQGQNQQTAGFWQAQHPSQQFSALGHPNYFQTSPLLEHQQQSSRDGSLVGSQGQPAKQTQQLWQNSY